MEWMHSLDTGLASFIAVLKFVLEFVAVACVTLGLVTALRVAIVNLRRRDRSYGSVRLQFGKWLAMALEFQLGADIVATTIAPSFEALGILAVIAAIRTFLNYFLQRELEAEQRMKEKGQGT
jgi:uncharacterized membrane protein